MSEKERMKPVALIGSIALAGTFAAISTAHADTNGNPFSMTPLAAGFLLGAAEGEAEGTCGEGKCGEGKCGGDDKGAHVHGPGVEGACGEGKCGEGKCGGDDKGAHTHGDESTDE